MHGRSCVVYGAQVGDHALRWPVPVLAIFRTNATRTVRWPIRRVACAGSGPAAAERGASSACSLFPTCTPAPDRPVVPSRCGAKLGGAQGRKGDLWKLSRGLRRAGRGAGSALRSWGCVFSTADEKVTLKKLHPPPPLPPNVHAFSRLPGLKDRTACGCLACPWGRIGRCARDVRPLCEQLAEYDINGCVREGTPEGLPQEHRRWTYQQKQFLAEMHQHNRGIPCLHPLRHTPLGSCGGGLDRPLLLSSHQNIGRRAARRADVPPLAQGGVWTSGKGRGRDGAQAGSTAEGLVHTVDCGQRGSTRPAVLPRFHQALAGALTRGLSKRARICPPPSPWEGSPHLRPAGVSQAPADVS